MTPNEKAQELFNEGVPRAYTGDCSDPESRSKFIVMNAKQYAVSVVTAILAELREWGAPFLFDSATDNDWAVKRIEFWQEVVEEINKIESL